MRKVDYVETIPERLLEKGEAELKKATAYFGPPRESPKSFSFKAYKLDEVKRALEREFHGKCAYCETYYSSTQPMDVEHYRPKGAVAEDDDHPGYWWLAMSWENLLPSCIDCNRKRYQETTLDHASDGVGGAQKRVASGKKDSFPMVSEDERVSTPNVDVTSVERPLLLNPRVDDPDLHLKFYFDTQNLASLVVPNTLKDGFDQDFGDAHGLSRMGRASIDVYGLNRLGLVQERSAILRQLAFLETVIVDLSTIAQEMDARKAEHELLGRTSRILSGLVGQIIEQMARMGDPSAPYSRMVSAWLDEFEKRHTPEDL